jgi:hypothetical protein
VCGALAGAVTGGTAAQEWREWARELGLWAGAPEWWRPVYGSWGDVVADLAGAEVCGERVAAGAVWAQAEELIDEILWCAP